MFNITCNIDKSDRINRSAIGVLLILAALVGFGKIFMMLLGVILIAEGVIGWCGIPLAMERLKQLWSKQS